MKETSGEGKGTTAPGSSTSGPGHRSVSRANRIFIVSKLCGRVAPFCFVSRCFALLRLCDGLKDVDNDDFCYSTSNAGLSTASVMRIITKEDSLLSLDALSGHSKCYADNRERRFTTIDWCTHFPKLTCR